MKIRAVERLKLSRAEQERGFSDTTSEAITQIIERTLKEQGHEEAEAKSKELLLLIETGISEAELLQKLNKMT